MNSPVSSDKKPSGPGRLRRVSMVSGPFSGDGCNGRGETGTKISELVNPTAHIYKYGTRNTPGHPRRVVLGQSASSLWRQGRLILLNLFPRRGVLLFEWVM